MSGIFLVFLTDICCDEKGTENVEGNTWHYKKWQIKSLGLPMRLLCTAWYMGSNYRQGSKILLKKETLHHNIMNQAPSLRCLWFHFNFKKQNRLFPIRFLLTSHPFVALQLANLNDHCREVYETQQHCAKSLSQGCISIMFLLQHHTSTQNNTDKQCTALKTNSEQCKKWYIFYL